VTLSDWPLLVDRVEAARVLRAPVEVVDSLVASGVLPVVRLTPEAPTAFRPEDLCAVVDQRLARAGLGYGADPARADVNGEG
jgi:hypothetical protein